jgi:hypothetical protein
MTGLGKYGDKKEEEYQPKILCFYSLNFLLS